MRSWGGGCEKGGGGGGGQCCENGARGSLGIVFLNGHSMTNISYREDIVSRDVITMFYLIV